MKKTIFAMVMIAAMAVGNVSAQPRGHIHPGSRHHHSGLEIGHFVAGAIIGTVVDRIIDAAIETEPVVVETPAPVVIVENPAPVAVAPHPASVGVHHTPVVRRHHGRASGRHGKYNKPGRRNNNPSVNHGAPRNHGNRGH